MRVHDKGVTVQRLRDMAARNQYAKEIFINFSNRRYNGSEMPFNRLKSLLPNVPESEMIAVFKDLEHEGLGRINYGRGDTKSHFMWYYSVIDVGKVALGLKEDIQFLNSLYSADKDIFSQDAYRCKVTLRDGEFSSTVVLPRDFTRADIQALTKALQELPAAA